MLHQFPKLFLKASQVLINKGKILTQHWHEITCTQKEMEAQINKSTTTQ